MTPAQRRLRAQIAANAHWSKYMAREDQAAVRAAFFARLERQVDFDGKLRPDERAALVRAVAHHPSVWPNAAKVRKRAMSQLASRVHAVRHALPALWRRAHPDLRQPYRAAAWDGADNYPTFGNRGTQPQR